MRRLKSCLFLACAACLFYPVSGVMAAEPAEPVTTVTAPASTDIPESDTPASTEEPKKTETGIQYICSQNKEIHITGYEGTEEIFTIPSTIDGLPVTYIAEHAFENASFHTVTIPESVAVIEEHIFSTTVKTVKCYKSSAAYTYAKQHKVEIILLDPKLNITSKVLNKGKKVTLKITNASGKTSWRSSNTNVASVTDKGIVTAKKAGTAKITAVNNGHKTVCTVTVTNMKLSKAKTNVTVSKSVTLKLTNSGSSKVTWKSSSNSIATVNQKGIVTGKKKGTATITATCKTLSFTCKVTVLANERELYTYDLNISDLSKDTGYIGVKKIAYSGSDLKCTAYAFNNYSKKLAYASSITITLYQDGKQIGQQIYTNRTLNIDPHSQKKMTFVIRDKNLSKKQIDLRTTRITAKVTVGICAFA